MERLGDDARRLFSAAGAPEAGPLAAIVRVWPEAVGAAIARSAWPQRLARDGTLHVATVSATWAFELDRLSAELLERLGPALGPDTPAALRFAPGPVPEPPATDESPGTVDGLSIAPEARLAGRAVAAPISDPELRELVARAAAASLSRPPADRGFW